MPQVLVFFNFFVQILGSGMSNKMWDVLVEHAKTCCLSGKLYVYYPDDVRNVGVVFNHIYELSGLIAGEQYYPADSLSDSQKVGNPGCPHFWNNGSSISEKEALLSVIGSFIPYPEQVTNFYENGFGKICFISDLRSLN